MDDNNEQDCHSHTTKNVKYVKYNSDYSVQNDAGTVQMTEECQKAG